MMGIRTYSCDYAWKLDRKTLDGVMLDTGFDPAAGSYLDYMDKALSVLHGVHVKYAVTFDFNWPQLEVMNNLDAKQLGTVEDSIALDILKTANSQLQQTLVKMAIEGKIVERRSTVNFGELSSTLEMAVTQG